MLRDMKHVIAIVGMPGSGKGTVTDYLEEHGMPTVHFGSMVYEEVKKRGLDIVKDEKAVREDMRNKEGKAVLAKRAAAKTKEYFAQGLDTVVYDGLYSWSEYKYLRQEFGNQLVVVAIFTPRAERYQRVAKRRDGIRVYTEDDIKKRDVEEIENIEKGGPIAMADYTLLNTKTQQDLVREAATLLNSLGVKVE